jgi:hypothetical protein
MTIAIIIIIIIIIIVNDEIGKICSTNGEE